MKRDLQASRRLVHGPGALSATFLALFIQPLCAGAASPICPVGEIALMRSQMSSWSITEPATIDSAQHLADIAGACSGPSTDPQTGTYALIAALASEVKARALREQKSDFTTATQTAYVMFRFVTNDKYATEKDRRNASLHLTAMSDLLAQSGIK